MTYADLVKKVTEILPNATFGEDNDGQLLIYTDVSEQKNGELIPFEVQGNPD